MHQVTLLLNIAMALVIAFSGGVIARRLGLPTSPANIPSACNVLLERKTRLIGGF